MTGPRPLDRGVLDHRVSARLRVTPILVVCLALVACKGTSGPAGMQAAGGAPEVADVQRVASTRGAALVISRDGRVAVACNRSSGTVTVFLLDPTADIEQLVQSQTEFDLGLDAQPWAAVIDADDDTAYVVLRGKGGIIEVRNLHTRPVLQQDTVFVGSEPTAIAITPSGARVFVANWGDGTLSVLTTGPLQHRSRVDLNRGLATTGVLGSVESRLALAHPRALAMTDDGDDDDDDETLYATEFFSQPLPGVEPGTPGEFDRNRQGFVYAMSVASGHLAAPIALLPVDDTGFVDSTGQSTGCFPNQLHAAVVSRGKLYVTSLCTSPQGPIGPAGDPTSATYGSNFKTLMHPVLFVVDTNTNTELASERAVLTRILEDAHAADGTDPEEVRMPLIANDIAVGFDAAQTEATAWLTAFGADALFDVRTTADGARVDVGVAGQRHIELRDVGLAATGRLPIGVALGAARQKYALVLNDDTRNVLVIDVERRKVVASHASVSPTNPSVSSSDEVVRYGRRTFVTGLDAWSYRGQAWSSCEACHPDGRSDGVTWFFARGPRRTLSTAGTYDGSPDSRRRMLLWTASVDEVHDIESVTRGISGGVGGILWRYDSVSDDCRLLYDGKAVAGSTEPPCYGPKQTTSRHDGLNGSSASLVEGLPCESSVETCDATPRSDWNAIDSFVRSVSSPQRPVGLDAELVVEGQALFEEGRCAACHGGPGWTIARQFYEPSVINNGALPFDGSPGDAGLLRQTIYDVAEEMRALNVPGQSGSAPFRSTEGTDQINCVLRSVGTFPAQSAGTDQVDGIHAPDAPRVLETQADMTSLALGAQGFNIPSLVGLASGAPYFHAGNARTLEEVFDPVFAGHHQALSPGFLENEDDAQRDSQVRALVAYLLAIDDLLPEVEPPSVDDGRLAFEADLCSSWGATSSTAAP